METLSAFQAAKLLGVSIADLALLEKQGILRVRRRQGQDHFYSAEEIGRIKASRGPTLAEEAAQVGIGIQREMASSVTFTRKILLLAGGALLGYVLLVTVFTILFTVAPLHTARFLGYGRALGQEIVYASEGQGKVLAATTHAVPEKPSLLQTLFRPVGNFSLRIVKFANPSSYAEVANVSILDTNDVLGLDTSGAIIPGRPINLPDSSLLQVGSSGLIANLNSQYLQDRQPGINPGDIAIVGQPVAPVPAEIVISPSSPDITNANLADAGLTIITVGPLSGGDIVALGGTTTISCPTCLTLSSTTFNGLTITNNGANTLTIAGGKTLTAHNSLSFSGVDGTIFSFPSASDTLVGRSSADTLTNKTIDASANTISGLTADNLTAGDFSSKIISGTYPINITGSVGSAVDFTGALAGDVTGTQGATVIAALTNANLSGAAGITNANLANSSITTAGNSGSGSVSLGGGLTFTGSGITTIAASGSSLTVTSTEADTLASVTGRGATTATALTLSNISNAITAGTLTATSGSINGITIGASTPSSGAFTTLSSTGTSNIGQGTGVVTLDSSGALNLTSAAASTWTVPDVTNALNFDSDTLTLDALNNRIGIGTTAPGFGLSVIGNTSSGNISAVSNLSTTSSSLSSALRLTIGTSSGTNLSRFVQFYAGATTDSNGTGVGNIRINGAGVAYATGNADLAEWTEVAESVAAGDIIASVSTGNKKAEIGNLLLGVVSDTAAFIGNETGDLTGKAIIGFLGRVNTKVSTENGTIAIGDPIAASSVAGVGMKQTKAGPTIGKALEAYSSGGISRIAIQVVPGWFDPDPLLSPSSFSISGTDILDQNSDVVTRVGGFQDIFAGDISIADELTLGTGILNLTSTSGALTLSGLSASSISAGVNTLAFTSSNFTVSTGGLVTLLGGQPVDITTTSGNALTIDSGTTGGISIGTGANAKTIAIGNITGATALNLSSGTGNINFTVDGTGSSGRVQIGNSATATPDVLVLDNGTADPAGVNGGMYYNTSTGKFRCFENSAWANCNGNAGDAQHAASYDTNEALTNIPTGGAQVTLGTVSVTPATANGDVYVTGWADVLSSNGTDQPLQLVIETTSNCTGTTVGNATVTYTITSAGGADRGTIRISGIAVDAGASAQPYSLCAAVTSGAGDSDVMNWGIEALVIDTGADVAEIYTTNDATIEVGDVVAVDSSLRTGMKKSQRAYDQSVLGVISTRPGLVIGGVDKEGATAMPVALSGRVPVKVSTENGAIKAGDALTSSSTPGVAMKSTKAGTIIGTAMSGFEGDNVGQILVFVKNGWSGGSSLDDGGEDAHLLRLRDDVTVGAHDSVELAMTESVVDADMESYITRSISDLFKNTIEFFGKVIFQVDVTFQGRVMFDKDTAGRALIKAGVSEVQVTFEKEYAQEPMVTASVNLLGTMKPDEAPDYAVYDVSAKGFTIKLSEAAAFDLHFSWIALAANGDNVSISDEPDALPMSPTPTVTPSLTEQEGSPSQEIIPSASPLPSPTEIATVSPTPLPLLPVGSQAEPLDLPSHTPIKEDEVVSSPLPSL